MGASTSRIDEDKALQLCRERKKFVQQALDGRCLLAAAHVSYVQSLKSIGAALRKFAETEVPVESSLYTSTSGTPEQALPLTEKSVSHLSYSPPPASHSHHDTYSPPPSPPSLSPFQVNHMKFRRLSSKIVEEKPPVSVVTTVTSSSTPKCRSMEKMESAPFEESSSMPSETPPWDYFGLSHPIDNQFASSHVGNGQVSKSVKGEDETTEVEEDGDNFSFQEREESRDSEDDEFDEPTTDTLVRSFENFNRVRRDHSALPQREGVESEFSDTEKSKTPELSPPVTPLAAATPVNKTPRKGNYTENKLPPRDFLSIMKEIELLFVRASETGKEVPRMLEANKLHFRPIVPSKESGSGASSLFKTCLSCGEGPKDVPEEEPAQNSVKYLTWHRTESSRSSSSRNPLGGMNCDEVEELNSNLFENISMIAGSHASTLDRLFAWERKLYDEVKGSQTVRREYDEKCRVLRELESEGKGSQSIDKTRAVVKDLHSRIRVAIHRINSISRRIEELRDKELQPQLEELIEGLSRMWEVMLECHKVQFRLISACHRSGNIKLNMQSELHRQVTSHLEDELRALASSFTKWITGQKSYIKGIHEWLEKCVIEEQKYSKRKRRPIQPSVRHSGPPIYATCGIWLEKLEALPTKEVSSSIKALASDVARFLPRQEKNRNKKHRSGENKTDHVLQDETLEDCGPGFDRFRTSLEGFARQLNQFAESSVKMYEELKQGIQEAKNKYGQFKAYSQGK